MVPTKIRVNWPFGSGEEAKKKKKKKKKNRYLRWWPSWISDRNDFNYF